MMLSELLAVVEPTIDDEFFPCFAMGGNVLDDVIVAFVMTIDAMDNKLVHLFFLVHFEEVSDAALVAIVENGGAVDFDSNLCNNYAGDDEDNNRRADFPDAGDAHHNTKWHTERRRDWQE